MTRNLLKDSLIYTSGNVVARGLSFIIQVTVWSNLFPPEVYGQIAYCYVFISFMAVILPFGTDAAFMNY
ncbi:MAG: oligosaccharide flippase family protein, partial [FCB group bacterium]|nr:oligosaccharide flippase family protein [FCB group bacterium]